MGIDIRIGKGDYNTRYKVYKPNTDIRNVTAIDSNFCGILHAKDITAYDKSANIIAGKFQRDATTATIETRDRIEIDVDYYLYAIAEDAWYIVKSAAPNSHNETQRWSSRPVNTTAIVIKRTK